jgi:hypothetical protein
VLARQTLELDDEVVVKVGDHIDVSLCVCVCLFRWLAHYCYYQRKGRADFDETAKGTDGVDDGKEARLVRHIDRDAEVGRFPLDCLEERASDGDFVLLCPLCVGSTSYRDHDGKRSAAVGPLFLIMASKAQRGTIQLCLYNEAQIQGHFLIMARLCNICNVLSRQTVHVNMFGCRQFRSDCIVFGRFPGAEVYSGYLVTCNEAISEESIKGKITKKSRTKVHGPRQSSSSSFFLSIVNSLFPGAFCAAYGRPRGSS